MGDGSLSLDRFSYFMRQDYLFLIDYCRVVSLACAKCPDLESMGWWARLLDETLNSEMALHQELLRRLRHHRGRPRGHRTGPRYRGLHDPPAANGL